MYRLVTLALLVIACADGGSDLILPPPPPPAPPLPDVTIEPTEANLTPNSQVQFRALIAGYPDAEIAWTLADPAAGTLDATGLFRAATCVTSADSRVTATWLKHPEKQATAEVHVLDISLGVSIQSMVDAGTGEPVRIDAVRGTIDVSVRGLGPRLCSEQPPVTTVVLWLGNGTTAVPVAQITPPRPTPNLLTLRWETTGSPNGEYSLSATLHFEGQSTPIASMAIPIRLVNP